MTIRLLVARVEIICQCLNFNIVGLRSLSLICCLNPYPLSGSPWIYLRWRSINHLSLISLRSRGSWLLMNNHLNPNGWNIPYPSHCRSPGNGGGEFGVVIHVRSSELTVHSTFSSVKTVKIWLRGNRIENRKLLSAVSNLWSNKMCHVVCRIIYLLSFLALNISCLLAFGVLLW